MAESLLAVKAGLVREGVLGKVRTEIRSEVLRLLGICDLKKKPKPPLTPEVGLINELIGDYLQWIGYSYTNAIFSSESDYCYSGNENACSKLIKELGLEENDSLPLICRIISKVAIMNNSKL